MSLPANVSRCPGFRCPSAMNCRRFKELRSGTLQAAFYARREAGTSACEHYLPVKVVSTFAAVPVDSEGGEI